MALESLIGELAGKSPGEILQWVWDRYGPAVAMTSSFQSQSLPLLHLVSRVVPEMPVLFLDTGFHFPETLRFRDRLVAEWDLKVLNLRADRKVESALGPQLPVLPPYQQDPDQCCYVNKVQPLREALKGLNAYVSGIRRDQTRERSNIRVLESAGGFIRVHPIGDWTERDVWRYIHEHDLPVHPLFEQGYASVGCAPCTAPPLDAEDGRSGRWAGREKTECGIHTHLRDRPGSGEGSG